MLRVFKLGLSVSAVWMSHLAFATSYTWTLSADDPDNVITNAVHLSVPLDSITPADTLTIKAESDMTVRMPAGTYTGVLSPYFDVAAGKTLTYDGLGVWKQQDISEGTYLFTGLYDDKGKPINKSHFKFLTAGGDVLSYAVNEKSGTYSFDNVKFRLRRAATGSETWLDLDRGTMNFYDPNGTGRSDNLYTLGGGASPMTLAFHEGSTFRAPTLLVYGEHEKNYVIFDGGSDHYIYKFSPRSRNNGSDTSVDRTTLRVTGANTKLTLSAFSYGNDRHHRYRVDVISNATLAVLSDVDQHKQREETDRFYVTDANIDLGYDGASVAYWSAPNLFANNMTFRGLANKTTFRYAGTVHATNSTFTAKAFAIAGNGVDFEMVGGSFDASDAAYFGSDASADVTARFDGVEASFAKDVYIGDAVKAIVTLTNTAMRVTSKSNMVMLGNGSIADGTLNVGEGATLDCAYRLVLSGLGNAALNVGPGGTLKAVDLHGYWNSAENKTVRLHQTGGLVSVGTAKLITGGSSKNSTAVYQLDGGEFRTSYIDGGESSAKDSSKTTTAYVKGNGGTIVATAATATFICNLNGLLAGERGLTISSDYDITIPQSVENDGTAEGRLVLTGSGVKTLSGTATTVAVIEVAGGTVKFAAGARATSKLVVRNGAKVVFEEDPSDIGFTGFVAGDATSVGVIALAHDQTLAIAGNAEINQVQVEFLDDFALNTTSTLITVTGTVPAATAAAWVDAAIGAGSFADRSYIFSVDEDVSPKAFEMAVSTYAYEIEQTTGAGTVSEGRTTGAMATGHVTVESGASLTLSGVFQKGGLTKTGTGALYLTGLENIFLRAIISEGGLFSVPDIAALGASGSAGFILKADTFEYTGDGQTFDAPFVFQGAENSSVVVLKNEGDLTLTDVKTECGAPLKRGVGKLTIAPKSGTTTVLASGNGSSKNYDPADYSGFSMPADGTAPTKGHLGFNILEGTVEIKGDATTTVSAPYSIAVGMCNNDSVRAQPVLRIDGAKVQMASGSCRFMLGTFTKLNGLAARPRVEILNGADFSCASYMAGRNVGVENFPTTVVDRATANFGSFCAGWSSSSNPKYFFRNGATVYSSSLLLYGSADFFIENATWTKSDGSCFTYDSHATRSGIWNVGTNSVVACSQFTFDKDSTTDGNRLQLNFDGGTWLTGDGVKPTFHINRAANVVIRTKGAGGLTLPVAAAKTVDVARAITGDGGVIKTGAGTLNFETQGTWDTSITTKTPLQDPVSLAFEGTLDVREGAVTVDATACRTGGAYKTAEGTSIDFGGNALGAATLAGGGSFVSATVSGGTIGVALDDDGTLAGHPTFTDVAFEGRVRVDFGRTEPLESSVEGLVVATFPKGAPNVSGWRSCNTGKGKRATFRVADNGKDVLADVATSGFLLIVR